MEPYIGEIRAFAFSRALDGWLPCEGQILQTFRYSALYALIRNTYGGKEGETFALPDLRGRVPVGKALATQHGSDYELGKKGGAASVVLGPENMPAHHHELVVAKEASGNSVRNAIYASTPGYPLYAAFDGGIFPIDSEMIAETGEGQPHDNMQPTLVLRYYIAVRGIYPSGSNAEAV